MDASGETPSVLTPEQRAALEEVRGDARWTVGLPFCDREVRESASWALKIVDALLGKQERDPVAPERASRDA